jgi:hypothetical protein
MISVDDSVHALNLVLAESGHIDVDAVLAPVITAIRKQFDWPLADAELLLADARRDLIEMFDGHGAEVVEGFRRELKLLINEGD